MKAKKTWRVFIPFINVFSQDTDKTKNNLKDTNTKSKSNSLPKNDYVQKKLNSVEEDRKYHRITTKKKDKETRMRNKKIID